MTFYLDYNATTPLAPEAARAMRPFFEDDFGNPSSMHSFGRAARMAVDRAREQLAALLGAQPKEILFTSGGTESNNLALSGAARALHAKGRHIVTCAAEHHAVLHPCQRLAREGFEVTLLPVDQHGVIRLDDLARALRPDTILVSIMSANNETGTRQPVAEIGRLCRERGIVFHCDAIQSFGKERVLPQDWQVDLLSLAAHKFYGPKGTGLLYIRSGVRIEPVQVGGAHENDRRAGTENVPGMVGLAAAAQQAAARAETENQRLFDLTENLWTKLSHSIPDIRRNGHPANRLGNTLNVSFSGCDGEGLIVGLDLDGVAVSSGSACMVGSLQPSHVLQAMGIEDGLIRATVRFSLGAGSKEAHLPEITRRVTRVVERLRKNPVHA